MDALQSPKGVHRFFLGRERELGELSQGLTDTLRGRGHLYFLSGEAGIGKTALAEEAARQAAEQGISVAWGRCWESAGAPPYWPWVQVIRHCVRTSDVTRAGVTAETIGDVAQIVPELRQHADKETTSTIPPEQERFRLFDSVATFFRLVTGNQPLLILLDDLHWADEASLLLLHFVARELRGLSMMLIGTYREGEASLRENVGSLLTRSAREGRVLSLLGWSADEIDGFVERRTQKRTPPAVVAQIQQITEGNPLFVEEVLQLLKTSNGHAGGESFDVLQVPEGVRDVIRRRLDTLPIRTRDVLTNAAVLGREFDLAVLERMTGDGSGDEVGTAVRAGVLLRVAGPAERYRFSHALVTETLYIDIPVISRVDLHERAAGALLAHWGSAVDDHLDEIAHHFLSAAAGGGLEAAVDWAVRAGEHALEHLAFETAAASFTRALDTMRSAAPTRDAELWMRKRVALLLRLATARNCAGDGNGVNEALLEAINRARDLNDPRLFASTVLALGTARVDRGGADAELVALLQESLERLGSDADALRARLLARLASSFYLLGSDHDRARISLEAVELARRSGDAGALASALSARHSICWQGGSSQERLDLATEIVRLAHEAGEQEAWFDGLGWRIFDLLELGDIASADAAIGQYEQRANETRLPLRRWYASVFRTMRAMWNGRFGDAERLAAKGLTIRQVDGSPPSQFYAAQMFAIRRKQGRLAELEPALRAFTLQYPGLLVWRCVIAVVHVDTGDLKAAREEFERLAANGFQDLRQDVNWLPTVSMLAEVCSAVGDAERARLLYELLEPSAGRNVVVVGCVNCLGVVDYYLGLLAATMKQWDSAMRHLSAAYDEHRRMQAWPLAAQAQFELARALRQEDPSQKIQAATLIDQARATARNLGMHTLERVIEAEIGSPSARFRRDGDHWAVQFEDVVVRLKDNRGCVYIAYLLANPGRQIAASELLAAAGATGSSDEQARVAVRKAVTSVLRALAGQHDRLRQHFTEHLHTGRLCSYTPSEAVVWDTES